MIGYHPILLALLSFTSIARADLTLEQQSSDTNRTRAATIRIHCDKMRLDQIDDHFSVIFDLKTRDSFTLLATNKTYLKRFGSEIRWEMEEEKKYTGGTNEMDRPPERPVDTGASATVNGYPTKIFTWRGARGQAQTLWVATNFPNYAAVRAELYKLDKFNDSGPHRNAQPYLSQLPGMVVRTETMMMGHGSTNRLVSVQVQPLDDAIFSVPADYTFYQGSRRREPSPATEKSPGK